MKPLAVSLLMLISSACSSTGGGDGEARVAQVGGPWTNTSSLDEMMLGFIEEHEVPGAALAVSEAGEVVYSRGFGLADLSSRERVQPDSLFRIASISKPITAVAVMQLVARGKVSLDAHLDGAALIF